MNAFDREQYLKQLRMYYSGDRESTEQFLEDMSDSLDCYLMEHPSASAIEIFAHFGHPRELMDNYENALQKQYAKRKKYCFRIVAILICSLFVIAVGIFLVYGHRQLTEVNGHGEIKLETYTIDTTDAPKDPLSAPTSESFIHKTE